MLKHDLHDRIWFFDIEWVPDAAAAKRLFDLADDVTEQEAIEAMWLHSGATEEKPRPFVKHLFSRVVSIAFLSRNIVHEDGVKRTAFALHSLPKNLDDPAEIAESRIIDQFLHYIGHRQPQLVGYNSVDSDLQVLIQRGLINEVRAPVFCLRPDKPWEGRDYFSSFDEWHLDLMKLFSSGRLKPKLDELARLCGFPGKIDMNGDQVPDLWLQGNLAKIIEYNRTDVLNTYLVWLRLAYFCGKLKEEDYASEQEDFRAFLEEEAQKHDADYLRNFLERWEY